MILAHPQLHPFAGAAIPEALKSQKRWTPWRAQWDVKRQKFDKIPVRAAQPEYGVSSADLSKWSSFEDAVRAYVSGGTALQGVGYLMTGEHGVVGFDLDNCVENGVLAPWAREIVKSLDTYTEISPSGQGVRMFAHGVLEGGDWTNHEVGIEVYGGSAARFLTVTGKVLEGSPAGVRPVSGELLAGLRGAYGRASSVPAVKNTPVPAALDEADVPEVHDLDLPPRARDFLRDGDHAGDRSRTLHSTAVALFSAGLSLVDVFSVLHHNPHAMAVALDHRRNDPTRADVYLWDAHCLAAEPKARPRSLTALDFDDLETPDGVCPGAGAGAGAAGGEAAGGEAAGGDVAGGDAGTRVSSEGVNTGSHEALSGPPFAGGGGVADDFEDVSGCVVEKPTGKAPTKAPRFSIVRADHYVRDVRLQEWFFKGVLPRADVVAVYGASGSGKTFFVLDMVCHLAMGLEWFGIASKPAKVLYVAAEGASGMRERMMAWCAASGTSLAALGENLSILGDQPNLLEKDDVLALVKGAREACPGTALVVLDTMAQVTPGANENSGEDMGRFLANVRAMGKAMGATMLMVGHSGKDDMRGLRGWSGLRAALDAELEVVRTNDYRAATVTKLKDGEGEGVEYRFGLATQVVDWNMEDNSEVSSLAVQALGAHDTKGAMTARDTAASERKGDKKTKAAPPTTPEKKEKAMSDKAKKVLLFVREHLSGDVSTTQEALEKDIRAHFLDVEGFFSPKQIAKHDTLSPVRGLLKTLILAGLVTGTPENLQIFAENSCNF